MADRVDALIADVQANMQPRNRLPPEASEKWPGIAVLETNPSVEPVEFVDEQASTSEGSPFRTRTEEMDIPGLRDDIQYVGFPEHVDALAVLDDFDGTAGIESIDALAFYLPFHFYRRWGIYIRERGLIALAVDLDYIARQNGCRTMTPSAALDFAYRILWSHEYFHFLTEVACARLQQSHPPSAWLYPGYFAGRQAGLDEEALANAYALKHAKRTHLSDADKALRRATRMWMPQLGPGYRNFPACEGNKYAPAKDRQVDHMAAIGSGRQASALFPGRLLYRDIPSARVPTFLVRDAGGLVSLVREFPPYGPLKVWAYTNDHRPPHVHTGRGPGSPKSERFEWPSRANMDGAAARVVKQFNEYADRFSGQITTKVSSIDWK